MYLNTGLIFLSAHAETVFQDNFYGNSYLQLSFWIK